MFSFIAWQSKTHGGMETERLGLLIWYFLSGGRTLRHSKAKHVPMSRYYSKIFVCICSFILSD